MVGRTRPWIRRCRRQPSCRSRSDPREVSLRARIRGSSARRRAEAAFSRCYRSCAFCSGHSVSMQARPEMKARSGGSRFRRAAEAFLQTRPRPDSGREIERVEVAAMKPLRHPLREKRFPDWPLAAKSILGFWLFYAVTVVARAFLGRDP